MGIPFHTFLLLKTSQIFKEDVNYPGQLQNGHIDVQMPLFPGSTVRRVLPLLPIGHRLVCFGLTLQCPSPGFLGCLSACYGGTCCGNWSLGPGMCCYHEQFKHEVMGNALTIERQAENRAPQTISSSLMVCYSSLRQCSLESWKKTALSVMGEKSCQVAGKAPAAAGESSALEHHVMCCGKQVWTTWKVWYPVKK